jgi:PAS domain S-box-containing protein
MLSELLQEQAALYAAGVMTSKQREQFEVVVEFHDELREFVRSLVEVSAAVTLATRDRSGLRPTRTAKARILAAVSDSPQEFQSEAMVMSGPDGLVQWVNPAFSTMCGYTLEELRGKKLGPILQGEKTDPETAARIREAVHACRPCRETILNYHKSGVPYWVEISISPIHDESGEPLWLVAREREVSDFQPD